MTAVYFMYKANGGEPLARLLACSLARSLSSYSNFLLGLRINMIKAKGNDGNCATRREGLPSQSNEKSSYTIPAFVRAAPSVIDFQFTR